MRPYRWQPPPPFSLLGAQALQQLGWSDGRNVRIDYRWAAGDAGRFHRYAEDNPDGSRGQVALVIVRERGRLGALVLANASFQK